METACITTHERWIPSVTVTLGKAENRIVAHMPWCARGGDVATAVWGEATEHDTTKHIQYAWIFTPGPGVGRAQLARSLTAMPRPNA